MWARPPKASPIAGSATDWLVILVLGVVQVGCAYAVLSRAMPHVPAVQASLLLMIWYVLLAAAAGVREGFHIRITVIEGAVSPGLRRYMQLFAHAVVGLFGVAMAVWGTELMAATWGHVIPTLGLPRAMAYIPFPIAGVLILGFSVEQMLAAARGTGVRQQWN